MIISNFHILREVQDLLVCPDLLNLSHYLFSITVWDGDAILSASGILLYQSQILATIFLYVNSRETQVATSSVYTALGFQLSKTKGGTFHCAHSCSPCAFPALLPFITAGRALGSSLAIPMSITGLETCARMEAVTRIVKDIESV